MRVVASEMYIVWLAVEWIFVGNKLGRSSALMLIVLHVVVLHLRQCVS